MTYINLILDKSHFVTCLWRTLFGIRSEKIYSYRTKLSKNIKKNYSEVG